MHYSCKAVGSQSEQLRLSPYGSEPLHRLIQQTIQVEQESGPIAVGTQVYGTKPVSLSELSSVSVVTIIAVLRHYSLLGTDEVLSS